MPFLLLLPVSGDLSRGFTVSPTKSCLLCATPASTYRVQSPEFPKIVYYKTVSTDHTFLKRKESRRDSNRDPSAYQPNAKPTQKSPAVTGQGSWHRSKEAKCVQNERTNKQTTLGLYERTNEQPWAYTNKQPWAYTNKQTTLGLHEQTNNPGLGLHEQTNNPGPTRTNKRTTLGLHEQTNNPGPTRKNKQPWAYTNKQPWAYTNKPWAYTNKQTNNPGPTRINNPGPTWTNTMGHQQLSERERNEV